MSLNMELGRDILEALPEPAEGQQLVIALERLAWEGAELEPHTIARLCLIVAAGTLVRCYARIVEVPIQ